MMVRIKWLLIGFFAGAATCGAASKWGCCSPDWMKMGGGDSCCCGDGVPADEPAGDTAADEVPAV